jgi:hypothetical protein
LAELPYEETRQQFEVVSTALRSGSTGASYGIGELETPSLGELRQRAQALIARDGGTLRVSSVVEDVGAMHRDPANGNAMFQVASQFNLLEMTGPIVEPENGVTQYIDDRTQGPACALSASVATVYRNYFVLLDGKPAKLEIDRSTAYATWEWPAVTAISRYGRCATGMRSAMKPASHGLLARCGQATTAAAMRFETSSGSVCIGTCK